MSRLTFICGFSLDLFPLKKPHQTRFSEKDFSKARSRAVSLTRSYFPAFIFLVWAFSDPLKAYGKTESARNGYQNKGIMEVVWDINTDQAKNDKYPLVKQHY